MNMRNQKTGWFLAFLAVAAAVRWAGIMWGLPNTFNADEPHLVNLAVSFGGGSLRPYAFKYPSLWPYLLFLSYGFYFLLWSGFGLRHGVRDFVGLYAWDITGFYLIGRWLAAICQILALCVIWRMERPRRAQGALPWASLLLAFAPTSVELAHSAKPDSLMFLFICAAWYFALAVYEGRSEDARRDYWGCGVSLGLALSSQFTALGAWALLPLAHFLRKGPRRHRYFMEACGLALAAFFAGSPFILIDYKRFWFWASMVGPTHLMVAWSHQKIMVLRQIVLNFWGFAGWGSIAGLAVFWGFARLWTRERARALLLGAPLLSYMVFLSNNVDGGGLRYLAGCFPGLALLAAEGLSSWDRSGRTWRRLALALLAFGPGLWRCVQMDRDMRLPDTRETSREWILANVPQGAVLLLELPHASPRLDMIKEQAEELWKKTLANGSPRARLYRGMADSHPGGGYRIYRHQHSAREAANYALHVELSQADWPTCDVGRGLSAARDLGIEYVVTSNHGSPLDLAPEKNKFFKELYREGNLLAGFDPAAGRVAGPVIRVFKLASGRPRSKTARLGRAGAGPPAWRWG